MSERQIVRYGVNLTLTILVMFLVLVVVGDAAAQVGTVLGHQKISDTEGGIHGDAIRRRRTWNFRGGYRRSGQ